MTSCHIMVIIIIIVHLLHSCAPDKYRRWIFINKQKFLAELGRLLTFMYDEDRQTVLAMYGRMFDETANEEGLLELLVSPTRQAVVLARSYDAKARKAQLEAQGEDADFVSDPDNVPAFIFVIDKTAQQAAELGVVEAPVAEGQFSIFDEADELPGLIEESAGPAAEAKAEEESAKAEAPAAEEAEEAAPAVEDEAAEETAEPAEESGERSSVDETADAVDAFLADFAIENGELVSVKAEEDEEAPVPVETAQPAEEPGELPALEETEKPAEYRLKTNILLLIVYIFLAIPVGIVGVAVLLLPTALFLALASGCGYVGVSAIGMSFGSFAVIADTMAVFGAGLALVALALLFVWLFVWFLGGAIVGFIRALCRLGRKICCKEVAVQ